MVSMGRKAQVLARRGMDIQAGNHHSKRRAFSSALTKLNPNPPMDGLWDSP